MKEEEEDREGEGGGVRGKRRRKERMEREEKNTNKYDAHLGLQETDSATIVDVCHGHHKGRRVEANLCNEFSTLH